MSSTQAQEPTIKITGPPSNHPPHSAWEPQRDKNSAAVLPATTLLQDHIILTTKSAAKNKPPGALARLSDNPSLGKMATPEPEPTSNLRKSKGPPSIWA